MPPLKDEYRSHFRKILRNCFVEPLRSRERAFLYLSALLGSTGFASFELFMAFDVAGMGLHPLMIFFGLRYFFGGIVLMPFGFIILKRLGPKTFFKYVVPVQILIACASVAFSSVMPYWLLGCAYSSICAPFWWAFHSSMSKNTSTHNRGNEVVLSDAGFTIGIVLGSVLAGVALAAQLSMAVAVFALVLIGAGTLLVVRRLKSDDAEPRENIPFSALFVSIKDRPRLSLMTLQEAMIHTITYVLAPVWMKFLGIGGLIIGIINACAIVLKIILTPFVGHFVNNGDARDMSIGSLLYFSGWLPMLISGGPVVLATSWFFWTAGSQVCIAGLMTEWYGERCLVRLAGREMILGVSRLVTVCVCAPILYMAFQSYIWAALLVALVMSVTALLVYRQRLVLKRKIPVVEISTL